MSVREISSGTRYPLRARRAERLRREIRLLEQMDDKLWRKALICAAIGMLVTIPMLLAVAIKLHYILLDPLAVTIVSIILAVAVWWIWRYALSFPLMLVAILLGILFDGHVDMPDIGEDKSKANRKKKLAAALAKRRSVLATLETRA